MMAACLEHGLMVGKSGPVFGSNGNVDQVQAGGQRHRGGDRGDGRAVRPGPGVTSRRRFDRRPGRSASSRHSTTRSWPAGRGASTRFCDAGYDAVEWTMAHVDDLLRPGLGAGLPAGPGHRRRGGAARRPSRAIERPRRPGSGSSTSLTGPNLWEEGATHATTRKPGRPPSTALEARLPARRGAGRQDRVRALLGNPRPRRRHGPAGA